MSAALGATIGLARATLLDTLRRPGFPLGVAAVGALLALLPRLGSPAGSVRDNAALALELSISSLMLLGPIVAGLLAVRATQQGHDAGLAPEVLSAPQGSSAYVVGRWLGVGGAAVLVCVAAPCVGMLGWLGQPVPATSGGVTAWVGVLCGIPVAAMLGAALGLVYGVVFTGDLAAVAFALHLVGARVVTAWGSNAPPGGAWAHHLVPDPARLDAATELAFGRTLSAHSVAFGLAAAAFQQAALVLLVSIILRRKTRAP